MATLRRYQSGDLAALYRISLATGLHGGDASQIYDDPQLMGHIYSAPYAVLEPDLAFVAETDGAVAGFVLGTLDTRAWLARLEAEWWPALRPRYRDPSETPEAERTLDQRRCHQIHHPPSPPRAVVDRFPAHLHLNLLPQLQRRGIGTRMAGLWCDRAAKLGATAAHVGVNRENQAAVAFWRRIGFDDIDGGNGESGRTIWLGRSL